jgi:GT2 family glycosyltransferase
MTMKAAEDATGPVRVSVSIVTYNSSRQLLRRNMDALYRALCFARTQGMPVQIQLLVLDNSRGEAYRASLRELIHSAAVQKFDVVDFWNPGSNIGFGAGHNQALERCDSEFHMILNPDVEMDEDVLYRGLQFLQTQPNVVMISSRATNARGQVEYLCKRYPSVLVLGLRAWAPEFIREWFHAYMSSYENREDCADSLPADVLLVSGCFMLARTDALRAASGFSDRFFMYFEDFDLSLRLRPLGRLVYLPSLHIVHHGGYAARKGLRHISMFVRSGWKFFQRHGWRWI